jgi:hypothetical protein
LEQSTEQGRKDELPQEMSFNESVNGRTPSSSAAPGGRAPPAINLNNGSGGAPPGPPRSAYDIFVSDMRSIVMVANRQAIKNGNYDVDEELQKKWKDLEQATKNKYYVRFEELEDAERAKRDKDETNGDGANDEEGEDVEMRDDTDEERS